MEATLALRDPQIPALLAPHAPSLCDACLGRLVARVESGIGNVQRGRIVRAALAAPSPAACTLCEGISDRLDQYAQLCLEAATEFEFATFLVGTVLFDEIRSRESALHADLLGRAPAGFGAGVEAKANQPAWPLAEWLKNEVNREVGLRIVKATGKTVDFQRPELTFRLDTRFDHVGLQVASLFGKGRYRKLVRDLPQTRWPCRACGGLGCRQCGGTGKTYETSVEELVAGPFLRASGAEGEAFHGMGREDIDARALGAGRPFVLELKRPRRRALDWAALARQVSERHADRVEVPQMQAASSEDAARYKAAEPSKTYRARCHAAEIVPRDRLVEAATALTGAILEQRTPQRVAHRRADLVRGRRVEEVTVVESDRDRFELEIRAQSGTYIKEFVSGDEGRTSPSFSQRLGVPVVVEELDVVDVDWSEGPGAPI